MIKPYNVDAWKFIKTMKNDSVQTIICDPPYDAQVNMEELRRICSGHIIMFCAPEREFFVPDERAFWIKTPSTKNYTKHLGRFVEEIIIERHGDVFNAGLHWSNYTGVYDDRLLTKQVHPYEKPLALMERLVAIYTRPGSIVFDPFMGSGTTLRAANNLSREAIGCEIEPKYFHWQSA
jgi:tRNA G10  N-methylase Trm11